MNGKKLIGRIITIILACISFIFITYDKHRPNNIGKSIVIGNDKKIVYKTFYIPFRLNGVESFIDLSPHNDICKEYIKKGIIRLEYEYDNKIYKESSLEISIVEDKFKYNEPIKIILKTKKNIQKCEFGVFVYPGKFAFLLHVIIFYAIPFFLVLANIILPILGYIKKILIKK